MSAPHAGCVELMVDRHVRAGRGAHTALVERGPGGLEAPGRRLTYAALQRLTQAIARQLDAGGATALRIAIVGSATLETVAWWLGGMRAGHQVFLAHPGLPAAQYGQMFSVFRPDLVLCDRTAPAGLGQTITPVEEYPGEAVDCAEVPLPEPDDPSMLEDARPALVLASSGSTGHPKLCVHAHRAFWSFERNVSRAMWGLGSLDRVLASGGPYFSFGLQGIHPPLSVGGTAILLPEWRAHADFLLALEAERATVFLGVPTLYHLLQSRTDAQLLARRTRTLRVAMSAGERLPVAVRRRWETHTGVPLCDSIGTTETFAPYLSEIAGGGGGLRDVAGFNYEMRFTETAGPGGDGVFMAAVKGPCMMLGYLGGDGRPVRLGDHFATQDLFMLKEHGWQFVSRRSERVKIAGHWVSPQELEEFLLQDERVVKAAAVVLETAEGLQRLRAYVVPRSAAEIDASELCAQLLACARGQLRPRALCPDAIHVVEDLSSTPTGKFKRSEFHKTVQVHQDVPGLAKEAIA